MREAKEEWEIKLGLEIRYNGDNGRKLWNHINRLSGKEREEENIDIFKEGKNLPELEGSGKFLECWRDIYRKK